MRTCQNCKEEKELVYFKERATVCNKCKRRKLKEKMNKFFSIDIGIEGLNTSKEKIRFINRYFLYSNEISVVEAQKLYNKGVIHVYSPDTVYEVLNNEIDDNPIVREEVLERDNFKCHYCNEPATTVDHIHLKSKGGKYTEENLVACCFECNNLRGDIDYEIFKTYREEIKEENFKKPKRERKDKGRKKSNDEYKLLNKIGVNKHGIPISRK